jgi:hypothetical protein
MADVGKCFGYLICSTDISYILWAFGRFCGNLVDFPRFGILYREKYGNPVSDRDLSTWAKVTRD